MPSRKCTQAWVAHSSVFWALGNCALPRQAMRAVSTLEKVRERASGASAGIPPWFSQASSSAGITALGFFSSRFFFR